MSTRQSPQLVEAIQLFISAFVTIGLLWAGLEWMIYGEVQPRIVDDLISLAWSAMAWCAYYLGLKRGRQIPRK